MIAQMQRVTIGIPRSQQEDLLHFLQDEEVLHITETPIPSTTRPAPPSDTAYHIAQLQSAIEFLERLRNELHVRKKVGLKRLFARKPEASLQQLQEAAERVGLSSCIQNIEHISSELAKMNALMRTLDEELVLLLPWKGLVVTGTMLAHPRPYSLHRLWKVVVRDEEHIHSLLASIPTSAWQEIHRETERKTTLSYIEVIAHSNDELLLDQAEQELEATRVLLPLSEYETVHDRISRIEQQRVDAQVRQKDLMRTAASYLEQEQDVLFTYDALLHTQEQERLQEKISALSFVALLSGWVPKEWVPILDTRLHKRFHQAAMESRDPLPEETPPVYLQNTKLIRPFEAVTDLYGKPAYRELDPSGPLALFFLIGFGLALTDAGYGILIMLVTFLADRYMRLKRSVRNMVRLMFYGGAITVVLGALTGGWFSISLDTLPESAIKDVLLSIKILDPLRDPMLFLGAIFLFGITQLLYAWVVKGIHDFRLGNRVAAIFDSFAWVAFVIVILGWIAASQGTLPASSVPVAKLATYILGGIVVLMQGRAHKNVLLRLGSGVMSLYALIAFVSDMLSYSRLLALGLATGIIGLVVNLIASMVHSSIPVVGVVLAGVVLVVGHVFNLGINALGAFIHSGRLQFVEFFPKFLEGGGVAFKPFGRVGKYVENPKDFNY